MNTVAHRIIHSLQSVNLLTHHVRETNRNTICSKNILILNYEF